MSIVVTQLMVDDLTRPVMVGSTEFEAEAWSRF